MNPQRLPELSVSVERSRSLGAFQGTEKISIGIFRLPYDATEADIQECLDTADMAAAKIRAEIVNRLTQDKQRIELALAPVEIPVNEPPALEVVSNPNAVEPHALDSGMAAATTQIELAEAFMDALCGPAAEDAPSHHIPADDEIELPKWTAFGTSIPTSQLNLDPITEINSDGTGGGQLKAVNTVLGEHGYKGKDRHWGALTLLHEMFGTRGELTSISHLTTTEASALLNWFDVASPDSLKALHDAASRAKGQIPLLPDDELVAANEYNPFEDDSVVLDNNGKWVAPRPGEPGYIDFKALMQEARDAELVIASSPETLDMVEPTEVTSTGVPVHIDPYETEFEFSDDQKAAIKRILEAKPGETLFLTGNAGAGKSTVVRYIQSKLRTILIASTGIAAMNIKGVTAHKFFGFSHGPKIKSRVSRLADREASVLERADLVILDEVSMVRADLMDAISWAMQKTMGNDLPFGGKTVLLVGDLCQLPPVVSSNPNKDGKSEADFIKERYHSEFFMDAMVFKGEKDSLVPTTHELVQIDLTQVHRQANPEFLEALNKIRVGDPNGSGRAWINKHAGRAVDGDHSSIWLCLTNKHCEAVNESMLGAIASEPRHYMAKIDGDWLPEDLRDIQSPETLTLKVGARVMITKNGYTADGIRVVNSQTGVVASIGDIPCVTLVSGQTVMIEPAEWENKSYVYDKEKETITEEVVGTFRQFPLKLGWAVTTHKSQGQTLDSATLELERTSFAPGQTYVALSRVTSIEGLKLKRPLTERDIRIAPRVKEYYAAPTPTLNMEVLL